MAAVKKNQRFMRDRHKVIHWLMIAICANSNDAEAVEGEQQPVTDHIDELSNQTITQSKLVYQTLLTS
jgi:hypothetical protein